MAYVPEYLNYILILNNNKTCNRLIEALFMNSFIVYWFIFYENFFFEESK